MNARPGGTPARAGAAHAGPRSNSWNYVPAGDVPRPPGAPCPLRVAGRPTERPARTLLLRLRDRMRLCATATSDFDDAELLRVKDALGQVYVDVSTKLAPDDFARDLRKLALDGECAACELRPRCGGCFVATAGDAFGRDDALVHATLRGLTGAVLDLGCGEGPYLTTLAEAGAAGRVAYLGVDPDAGRVAMLAAKHPWARFRVARAEDAAAEGPFDHVLVLRSWNHLTDPAAALGAAVSALRPGGSLLVVDNVAYGLVRTREHARAAEASDATLEHARNDDADDAARALAGLPLRLIERRNVGPRTSNQWLLRFERTDAMPAMLAGRRENP